jgi:hypothetical protein
VTFNFTHFIGGWVGPVAGRDVLERGPFALYPGFKSYEAVYSYKMNSPAMKKESKFESEKKETAKYYQWVQ